MSNNRQDKIKNRSHMKTGFYFLLLLLGFFIGTLGFVYFCFGYTDSSGLAFCSSLQSNTDSLAAWTIEFNHGRPFLNEAGRQQLDRMEGWMQILDESGQILYTYDSRTGNPDFRPESKAGPVERVTTSQLLDIVRNPAIKNGSQFVSTAFAGSNEYTVICGFPQSVSKSAIYYNSSHIPRLSPLGLDHTRLFAAAAGSDSVLAASPSAQDEAENPSDHAKRTIQSYFNRFSL